MRALIRRFDGYLRRAHGVFEFSDDPNCLWRLRFAQLPHAVALPDGDIPAGALMLELHLWNEHVPPMLSAGPDPAWAIHSTRMLIDSTRAVARLVRCDPRFAGVRAIGAVTMLFSAGDRSGGEKLMRRLGFALFPYQSPLGRFGEFWENLYTWWLMWAYNASSLRRRHLLRLRRTEMWMSANEFVRRYDCESARQ